MRYSQQLVEVALSPQLVTCFVDCIKEVGDNNGDVYAPPVFDISWRARLGLWVTNTNDDGVVHSLDPACD